MIMRNVNITTDATFNRLASSLWEACEGSGAFRLQDENEKERLAVTDPTTGKTVLLPVSPAEAWNAAQEGPIQHLPHVRLYYSKISDPNARDLKPRRLVPLEWNESKAGRLLARCYDIEAGFVKSFRIDQIQRILIRNQNLPDNGWGVTDISFRFKDDR